MGTLKGSPDEFGVYKFKGENMETLYRNNCNESSFVLREHKLVVRAYCSYHPAFFLHKKKQTQTELDAVQQERWKNDFKKVRSLLDEPRFEYIDVDEIVHSTAEPNFVYTDPRAVKYKGEQCLGEAEQQSFAKDGLNFEVHKVDYDPANFFKIVGRTADDHSVCLLARKPCFTFYVSHTRVKTGELNADHIPGLQQEVNTQLLDHLEKTQPFLEFAGLPVRLGLERKLKALDISAPKWMLKVTITESKHRFKVAEILDSIFASTWADQRPPKPDHKRFFPKNLKAIKTFQNRFTEIQHLLLDNNIYIRGWLDLAAEGQSSLRLVPLSARCSTSDLEYEIDCSDLKGHSPNPFEAPDPKWERQAPTRVLALDAEMLGVGGKFPRYEQDPVISIAAYSNTFDRANKKNYTEQVRLSAAGDGASQTRSTGRCNYDDGALFCLGSLAEVRSSKFSPTHLPNVPAAPKRFELGWNKSGRDDKGAYKSDYAISIRTWNAFLESFRKWVGFVGDHRARRIVNSEKLYTWLTELPIRESGNDPAKEWKEEKQILDWEERCSQIAELFPQSIKKKDIANLRLSQAWLAAMDDLPEEAAEREYGTIQARWKLCRPNASVFSFETEGDLFRGFYNYVRSYDPDIITGYNSNNFDLSYFINRVRVLELLKDDGKSFISMGRFKSDADRDEIKQSFSKATGDRSYHVPRINGRDAYDLMNYVMRDAKLDSYSLAAVAKHFLKDSKNDVPYSAIPSLFRNNRERLNAYCGKDAELVLMLINDMNNMNYLISLARLIGLMHLERLYVDGKQEQVFSVLMRWFRDEGANKVMNDRNKYSQDDEVLTGTFEGAHVFDPKTRGLFQKMLLCLDYNSLYPNIMRANNLGHDKAGTKARLEKYGYKVEDCFKTLEEFINPKTGLKEWYYFLQPRSLLKEELLPLGLDPEKDCRCTPGKEEFWIFEEKIEGTAPRRYRCNAKQVAEKQLRFEDAVYHKAGDHRARRIVNSEKLYTWLTELPIRESGNDPAKEWKEEKQILDWEERCSQIAELFPQSIKKKDIANLRLSQAWLAAMDDLPEEAAEREYGTIQARWKLCRPNASVFSFETEGDLFRGFYNYVRSYDPDIITGYNSNNFDLSYFINRVRVLELLKDDGKSFISMGRFKSDADRDEIKQSFSKATGDRSYHVPRINGRDAYDLMNYVMRDAKLDSYSLAAVAKHFLKDSKNDVPYSAIPSLFRNNRERLNAYCGKDAELVLMLINDMNNMNYLISLARLIGLMHLERLYVDGKQEQVFSVLMRWFRDEGANKVMNDRNKYSQDDEVLTGTFEGAHVFDPKTRGLFQKMLLCLDYNSLYPNIMRANNLGHDKAGTKARLEKYGYKVEDCFKTLEEFINPKTGLKEWYYFLQPRSLLKEELLPLGLDPEKDCRCTPGKEEFWIFEEKIEGTAPRRYRCNAKQVAEKQLRFEDAVYHKAAVPARYTPKHDVAAICSAVTKMLEARGRVNRLKATFPPGSVEYRRLDMIQMALKIICNSTYGATGVRVGKLAGMHISATVTRFGKRTILSLADRMAKDFAADVQGGDTDSIFVHFPSIQKPHQIFEKIDVVDQETGEIRRMTRIAQILEVANSLVPPPMKIDFEKAFLEMFAIAKKRAAALTLMPQWDPLRQENVFGKPKLDIKGLENKRRDTCKIAKDTITGFIERLFGIGEDGGDKEGREMCAAIFARKAIDRVDAGDIPFHEMIQSRQLSKKHYNTEVPHMVLNEKMRRRGFRPKELGERISFITITGRTNRSFSKSVEDPDYAMQHDLMPDYNYIVEKKLEKPLRRFTQYMAKQETYDTIMFGNRRKRHRQNLLEDDPIYSLVRRCVPCMECGDPSANPVCDSCKPTADWRKLIDTEDAELKQEETNYESAMKVCRNCTGVAVGEAIDCDNGTCPSYFPRKGGEFSIERRKAKIQLLEHHLSW